MLIHCFIFICVLMYQIIILLWWTMQKSITWKRKFILNQTKIVSINYNISYIEFQITCNCFKQAVSIILCYLISIRNLICIETRLNTNVHILIMFLRNLFLKVATILSVDFSSVYGWIYFDICHKSNFNIFIIPLVSGYTK